MNAIASPPYTKNSQARGKSTGWATFGLKQRQKQGLQLQQVGDDPFPPLPTTSITSLRPCENLSNNNNFSTSWADESLIEDIMASVNNDIDKATTLLEEMISTGNSTEKGEAKDLSNCDDFRCEEGGKEIALSEQTSNLAADIADLSSTLVGTFKSNHKQLKDAHTACERRLSGVYNWYLKLISELC
ncbi:uncharacterized protein LOC110671971 [Hevea brasiliensis]|uniref:uncharacterized protein LOC110671971 n=1 Tax=Hevea brasiliensis TaxID=3981 RepID=UPI0025ECA3B9|nr:uncharacterized protein LOC110671971 [Hevea brasiliensis]